MYSGLVKAKTIEVGDELVGFGVVEDIEDTRIGLIRFRFRNDTCSACFSPDETVVKAC